jgi:ketosteroid isomerase-like protein
MFDEVRTQAADESRRASESLPGLFSRIWRCQMASGPIDQVLAGYRAAVGAKDVDAFVALYDDEVEVFDTWGVWSHKGSVAWRAVATDWFGSLGDETVEVEFQEVSTTAGDEVAGLNAFIVYKGISTAGEVLRSMSNRFTWVLKKSGSHWKIVHEHSSAPVDPESGKVILQR